MIPIFVNGKTEQINAGSNLQEFLAQLKYSPQSFAIAVNEHFIPRSAYGTVTLQINDRIEIVCPIQGG